VIYVDALVDYGDLARERRLPGMHWCHLLADTRTELHAFAAQLRLRRAWFQDHPTEWHYDITPTKRTVALRLGAKPLTTHQVAALLEARHRQPTAETERRATMATRTIDFEILDEDTGELLSWGSTNVLDVVTRDLDRQRATHPGRLLIAVFVDDPTWKTRPEPLLPKARRPTASQAATTVSVALRALNEAVAKALSTGAEHRELAAACRPGLIAVRERLWPQAPGPARPETPR
jgi:Protein of unknown function (DUF4031)